MLKPKLFVLYYDGETEKQYDKWLEPLKDKIRVVSMSTVKNARSFEGYTRTCLLVVYEDAPEATE